MTFHQFSVGLGILLSVISATISAAETKQALHHAAMNPKLSTEQRIEAIQQLYPNQWREASLIKRRICIWDIGGRSGPIFAAAQDQKTELMSLGIEVEMEAYTSESIMAEELKAGLCDAAFMTGMKARTFNKFSGTIDSVGALPTLKHMKMLLRALSNPRAADKFETDRYIVLGIAPAGAAYIFVMPLLLYITEAHYHTVHCLARM